MPILAIETATRRLGVAVLEGGALASSYEILTGDHPHAVELPGAVRRTLSAAGTTLAALDAVVVDRGPGSFTGLRIGLAFVKALVFPIRKPLIGVPSLDVLAAGLPFASGPVCPMLDAKQKNVYAAVYRMEDGTLARQSDYLLGPVDQVLAHAPERTIFLGDGATLYRHRILERDPNARFAGEEHGLPNAATLARLGAERFANGEQADPATLVPLYLYPQDCQVRSATRTTSLIPPVSPP